jgi:SAM-dependent methyltransferase
MGKIFTRPQPKKVLPFSGERLTTALTGQTEIEHLHRYFLARTMCRGQDVLDVASGEGYGAALLAQVARTVVGVEIAPEAVDHAKTEYTKPNLQFLQSDARTLPLLDTSVDVVVSFETKEHFDEHDQFLAEIQRVLRAGGRLIISTPDRDNYSLVGTPANPFHVLEMTRAEFLELLQRHFAYVACWEQRPMIGSVMLAASGTNSVAAPLCFERRGDHFEESIHLARPQYIVAVASDRPVEALPDTIYIETSQLGAYEQEIGSEAARAEAARCAEVNAAQLESTRAEAARRAEAHSALQNELAVLERVNSRAEEAHAVLRQRIEAEIRHVAHLQGEVAKREQAIADLRGEREQAIADLYAEVVRRDQRISELKASRFSGRWKRLRRRLTGRG